MAVRLVSFFVSLVLFAAGAVAQGATEQVTIKSAKGTHTFDVELALTQQERSRGLMYRREVPRGTGMLFDFGSDRPITMWMKNTYVPLDMVFIGSDHKVQSIAKETTPLSETTIASERPVRFVLEVAGGTADRLHIRPGDQVSGKAIERN
ncbi:DUF192 domain-containing protein [Afifella sp. YEN Y35]|uniref:DUF192 domain-containing protein n=1 Tax=Afifella sp. YEN Y35 TaxID=3388337 RepID=UPI0039DF79F9